MAQVLANFFPKRVAIASSTFIRDLIRTKSNHHEPVNAEVYTIPCGGCDRIYIGETAKNLETRLNEHITYVGTITSTMPAYNTGIPPMREPNF